ncbi:SIS domain-containing protein [Sphingomonas sp. URHD0057]|uniref:SIS domain-containing protein n=1 Tax=Sphingomonas sp. URHD0057 TaxID=1380389 RepID=UPI0004921C56|nr:SIS domain-containing protein [Sphingomonas sp. URHD0057]
MPGGARPPSRMEAEAEEAALVADRQLREYPPLLADIGARLRQLDPQLVMTCARGSSDHAATYAKHLIEIETATPSASHSPSVSSIFGVKWRSLDRVLFLAVSQSGQSPDLVLSAKAAREAGALVVSIVNAESSPLAAESWATLPILAGTEHSVAATKSYIGSLLAVAALVAEWTGSCPLQEAVRSSPQALRGAWSLDWSAAADALLDVRDMYVIGRGSTLGIAQETALKFKETCGIHAEAVSAAEVRHGPMAIIGAGFPVLVLVPNDASRASVKAIAADLVARGAQVLAAGSHVEGAINLPTVPDLHPALAPAACMMSVYKMIAALSVARGLDPDAPPYLRKVTETR